jgi:hypothetical protein
MYLIVKKNFTKGSKSRILTTPADTLVLGPFLGGPKTDPKDHDSINIYKNLNYI